MSIPEWKKRIYDSYVSNGFGTEHDIKKYEMQSRYFRKNYLKFMPQAKDCKILELGCGMGEFCYFCLKEGYKDYTGIDASTENVAYINKWLSSDIKVELGDIFEFIDKVSNENKKYDVIILNDVIEHLPKQEIFELLDCVYKILRKDGVFLIKTPNMANPFVGIAGRYIAFDHEVGFTEYSLNQILYATGFSDVKIIGTDIYILNPLISIPAKLLSKAINLTLYMVSALYGRTSIKVFDKDILAAAYKRKYRCET